MPAVAPLLAALPLALAHVLAPSIRALDGRPRSGWLSAAGGVSVAYVFVHLLPELAAGQSAVRDALDGTGTLGALRAFAERHVYLVALAGLLLYYGLDKLALRSRRGTARGGQDGMAGDRDGRAADDDAGGVFAVHMASFACYDLVVGYLLVRGEHESPASLAFFSLALALHFAVSDYALYEHHRHLFRRIGRWLLVLALAAGVAIGYLVAVSDAVVAVLVAFLAGGIILNVLKEEVPGEREGRFWPFLAGAAGYAALLLAA